MREWSKTGERSPRGEKIGVELRPFARKVWMLSPVMHGDELTYITEAYRSNWMSTIGENINEVERICAENVGRKYAVALSTGTAALHMAVKLAGVKPGDRVFCSDMTFSATVNPVVYEGGIPVFIDSERETWNMDQEALERAFERYPDVRVVIAASLYGTLGKMDALCEVCKRHGAVLIEDAAESLGATYKGKQAGAFGTYGVVSYNGNKIITGSAGGALLTDDAEVAAKVRKWSTQSRESAPWYQHEEIGYNYRMSNVIAGVIRGQYPYLEKHIKRKKAIYMRYKEGLRDLPVSMNPYREDETEPNFWLSCLLIREDAMCEQLRSDKVARYRKSPGKTCPTEILESFARYNTEGRPIWKPMHMQPLYQSCDWISVQDGVDVGADIFARGLCLPSDINMTPEQQDLILEIIRSCFA